LAQPGARWRRVAKLLADEGFTVVSVDNREVGATGPCPNGFTLTDCALDIIELADSLGFDDFYLAGISMGGMIAQEVLAEAGDRVPAAALLATHPGGTDAIPPPDLMILVADTPQLLWTRLTGPGFAEANPEIIEEEALLSLAAATPLDGIMRQLAAIMQFDPGDRLAGMETSVVALHGTADLLIPYENGVRLAKKLGCELITFEGDGHALEFERPVEITEILTTHFAART
jgi:pimeloyl-ACP methyl ester carboxylesterase